MLKHQLLRLATATALEGHAWKVGTRSGRLSSALIVSQFASSTRLTFAGHALADIGRARSEQVGALRPALARLVSVNQPKLVCD